MNSGNNLNNGIQSATNSQPRFVKSKRFQEQLPITRPFFSQQPSYQCHSHSVQFSTYLKPKQDSSTNSLSQIFKSKGKGVLYHRNSWDNGNGLKVNNLGHIKVNSLLFQSGVKQQKHMKSIFRPYLVKNNINQQHKVKASSSHASTKTEHKSCSHCSQPQPSNTLHLNTFRKSHAVMVIRKLQKKKAFKAQSQKQKYEQQFRSKKQIPIHHTQYHFSTFNKVKTQGNTVENKQERNNRIISGFMSINNMHSKDYPEFSRQWEKERNTIVSQVRGVQIDNSQQRSFFSKKQFDRVNHISKFLKNKKTSPRKVSHRKHEEGEISPWKRSLTGQCDDFF